MVIGYRGHSILSATVLGGVSSYMIHRAHCSVHILRG
ncbi:MAG: universal stress protein [Trichodesmium erythraeum GBRTRLIN201]|nr:universal stress protein [Trichodesmium erythraeum GBRTRLIN201]